VGPVSFRLLFYIVKVMCYLVIIFAMNFNLQVINVHLAESPVTAAVAVFLPKAGSLHDSAACLLGCNIFVSVGATMIRQQLGAVLSMPRDTRGRITPRS